MNVKCNKGARRYSALVVPGSGSSSLSVSSAPRRLSAFMPDAVVRRLSTVSTTLGLASRNNASDCLIEQGKILCCQYMRSRMCCSGRRWRKHASASNWTGSRLVFPRLSVLGRHLERARPHLFATIAKHAAISPSPSSSSSSSSTDPADLVYGIGVELFKNNITWGKIVSLMAVCGALANSASRNNNIDELTEMLEAATAAMRGPLLPWLQSHGGWYGLVEYCQPLENDAPKSKQTAYCISATVGSFALIAFFVIFIFYT